MVSDLIKNLLLAVLFIPSIITDVRSRVLPLWLFLLIIAAGILVRLLFQEELPATLLAVLAISALVFLLGYFTKGMGYGDSLLIFAAGLLTGAGSLLTALLTAFFLSAVFGLVTGVLGKRGLKQELPFAPFLGAGVLLERLIMYLGGG